MTTSASIARVRRRACYNRRERSCKGPSPTGQHACRTSVDGTVAGDPVAVRHSPDRGWRVSAAKRVKPCAGCVLRVSISAMKGDSDPCFSLDHCFCDLCRSRRRARCDPHRLRDESAPSCSGGPALIVDARFACGDIAQKRGRSECFAGRRERYPVSATRFLRHGFRRTFFIGDLVRIAWTDHFNLSFHPSTRSSLHHAMTPATNQV